LRIVNFDHVPQSQHVPSQNPAFNLSGVNHAWYDAVIDVIDLLSNRIDPKVCEYPKSRGAHDHRRESEQNPFANCHFHD
jgi:hypothetical protein